MMLTIAVRSQNQFYQLGLLNIIEKVVQSEENVLKQVNGDLNSDITDKANIIFTEQVAIVNIFSQKTDPDSDVRVHPQATIHITFNTENLFQEEIASLIYKITNLSRLNYNQLIQDESFRKMMSRNNAQLSTKENRVVMMMSQGYNTTNISKILNCSQSTIYTHRRNALRKLGMINRVQLYKYTLLLKEFCYRENIFLRP